MSFPLDDYAIATIESRLAAGQPLHEAVAGLLRARLSPEGATVITDDGEATRDSMASALRFLALVTRDSAASIAVLGEFDSDPADALEEHDYIGRLIVRLNIGQLVAVGHGSRHIRSAAGLEGSWDGESVTANTPEEAYDLLRGQMRANDVVLVKAAARARLGQLADRLVEAPL